MLQPARMTTCPTASGFDSTGVWSSAAGPPSPAPSPGGNLSAVGTFTHALDRATSRDGAKSDDVKPSDRNRDSQHRVSATGDDGRVQATLDPATASRPRETQAELAGPQQANGSAKGSRGAADAGQVDSAHPEPEPAGGAQTANASGCALPAVARGSTGSGGPQTSGTSDTGASSTSSSPFGDAQNPACKSADPFQSAEAGQSRLDTPGSSQASRDGSPSTGAPPDGRNGLAQEIESAVAAEFSSLMTAVQETANWTSQAKLDPAALPEQIAASGSKAAQGLTATGFSQNQVTASPQREVSSGIDTAPPPSASTKTSPASSDNKPSGEARGGDQGSASDSGGSGQGKVESTADFSPAPQSFAVPGQPAAASSGQASSPTAPNQAPVPTSDGSYALSTWADIAARTGRIVTSAALLGGQDQSQMRVELRTEALGAVQLTASMQGDRIGAAIGVQTPEARSWLVNELPALHLALHNQNLHLDNVAILDRGVADGSLDRNTGGGPGSSAHEPPQSNSAPIRSAMESASGTAATPEPESWPVRGLPGRLSVRA